MWSPSQTPVGHANARFWTVERTVDNLHFAWDRTEQTDALAQSYLAPLSLAVQPSVAARCTSANAMVTVKKKLGFPRRVPIA